MQMVEWEWWRHGWGLYDAEKEAAAEAEAASEVIPVFRPLGSAFPGLLCMSRLRPTVLPSASDPPPPLGFGLPSPARPFPPLPSFAPPPHRLPRSVPFLVDPRRGVGPGFGPAFGLGAAGRCRSDHFRTIAGRCCADHFGSIGRSANKKQMKTKLAAIHIPDSLTTYVRTQVAL